MTVIDPGKKICTLINVFKIEPEKQVEIFNLLKKATEEVMCKLPGYISANLHISNDKKTITNYAQWASLEDFENMQKNEEAQKHMKLAASMAIKIEPVTYVGIWSHSIN